MEALKRAQVFIDTVQDKKNDADKVKKEDIMGDLKMRPPTPVWGQATRKNASTLQEDDKRRRAIILLQRLIRGRAM